MGGVTTGGLSLPGVALTGAGLQDAFVLHLNTLGQAMSGDLLGGPAVDGLSSLQAFGNDLGLVAGNEGGNFSGLGVQLPDAGPFVLTMGNTSWPGTNHNVGSVSLPGGYSLSNGAFTVWGDGAGIKDTADAFHFVHQSLTGDGQIVARLLSLQGGSESVEAGLMMRETLAPGSRHAFLTATAAKAATFRRRRATDGYSVQNSHPGTNYSWLRLMRMGNTFVGHVSTDGTNWEYVWFTTLNLPNQLEVGLAVTAHTYGLLSTGHFDNVTVGNLTPLPGPWPEAGPRIWLGGEPAGYLPFSQLGGFKVLVGGTVGDQFSVKCSTDVAAPFASWVSLGTITNQYGVVPFLDPQALTNQRGFYRLQKTGP